MEFRWAEDTKVIIKINELCDYNLNEEFKNKLRFLNDIKYKNYEQFAPGLNFFDHLFLWLKNFDEGERLDAVKLLNSLIFLSRDEIQTLSRQIFQEKIKKYLLDIIIEENEDLNEFDYQLAYKDYDKYLKQSLFIALSDGAMIDYFRRINIKDYDQTVSYYKLHLDAQFALTYKRFKERDSSYRFFFLIEDFVGTGTTFLRDNNNIKFWLNENYINEINNIENDYQNKPPTGPDLGGQLIRFLTYWSHLLNFNSDYKIIFCPYIITKFAKNRIKAMIKYYGRLNYIQNFQKIKILPQLTIPNELRVIKSCSETALRNINNEEAIKIEQLCIKYYDKIKDKETNSQKKGEGLKFGFGQRGLSIVRYNNVPNNSIYLIWFSDGWHPLFPRFKRHNK